MSLDFKVIPTAIRAQSAEAMGKLRADNFTYALAKGALLSFINEATLDTVAVNNLRQKAEDYMEVARSIMVANSSDIVDFQKLNAVVGEVLLIGEVIYRNQNQARDNIAEIDRRIQYYNQAIDSGNLISGAKELVTAMIAMQVELRLMQERILAEWVEKEQRYYEIESETSNLFTAGTELRTLAESGLCLIQQAAEGLPQHYFSFALNAWRTNIYNQRVEVMERTNEVQIRIDEMLESGETTTAILAGDPVNMSTGNYIYKQKDLEIRGYQPLFFQRFYNSLSHATSSVGKGWTHNYDIYMDHIESGAFVIYGEDGHGEFYEMNSKGEYLPGENNNFSNLIKTKENKHILKKKDSSILIFNHSGKVESIRDREDREILFEYEGLTLQKVESVSGSLSFGYENNKLTKVTDHTGREISFAYEDDLLVSYTNGIGNSYGYAYDKNHKLSKIINPEGYVSVENKFDEYGRATLQIFPDGSTMEYLYDDNNRITEFVKQNKSTERYRRNYKGHTSHIIFPDGTEKEFAYSERLKVAEWDRLENCVMFAEYDEAGNMLNVTNAAGVETEFEYTEKNRFNKIRIDGEERFNYTYDEKGNVKTIQDGQKNKTTFFYKEDSLIDTITMPDNSEARFTYDDKKNIIKMVAPSGITTKYKYDELNRIIEIEDGNGNKIKYQYDNADNLTEYINAAGDKQTYTYNKKNKVTKIENFDGSTIRREYNPLGKPSKAIDQLGRETQFFYDRMWNLSLVIGADKSETRFTYDEYSQPKAIEKPDKSKITYEYDQRGNKTAVTDEEGYRTTFFYDESNRLTDIRGEEGLQYAYTYSTDNRIVTATDGMNNQVKFDYNKNGQLTKEVNALGNTRDYTYTPLGKIATITNEAGLVTTYNYDRGGQLKSITHPDNTMESFTYDDGGNIKTCTNRTGQTQTYEYDCLDRVVKIIGSQGETKEYTYDACSSQAFL